MQTQTSDGDATWIFASAVPVGESATGEKFAVNPTLVDTLPARILYDGVYSNGQSYTGRPVHGLMMNPGRDGGSGSGSNYPQGWDGMPNIGTEYPYSAAVDVALPQSGPDNTYAKAVSILANATIGGRNKLRQLRYLTSLSEVPPIGSFMRWGGSISKTPLFTIADIDWSRLPQLAQPAGSTLPDPNALIARLGPVQTYFNQMLFTRGISAIEQQGDYGGDILSDLHGAMFYIMTTGIPEADRNRVAYKLLQIGLDIADASDFGRRWSSATFSFGGAHQWLKPMVVLAAGLLHNAANVEARARLQGWVDGTVRRVFGDDMMTLRVTRALIEATPSESNSGRIFPVGLRSYHEGSVDWLSKPSSSASVSFSYSTAYKSFNAVGFMGTALMTRLFGMEAAWNNPVFFEYCDRWHNLWAARAFRGESYLHPYARSMLREYYDDYAPAYLGTASPTLELREARNNLVWWKFSENLDVRFTPPPSAFNITVDGVPVTLATVTTTATCTIAGTSSMPYPTLSVPPGTTGLYVGMGIKMANVPADMRITSVNGNTIGISEVLPSTFAATAATFTPIVPDGRALAVVLPNLLPQGAAVQAQYTAPGTDFARNLRGVAVGTQALTAVINKTGLLPDGATTKALVDTGPTAALRQFSGAPQPRSETIKRMRVGFRFLLRSKSAGDTLWSSLTGSTAAHKLYFSSASDLRMHFAGVQFRMPGAGTALPLNTEITMTMLIDWTKTTYAEIWRAHFTWAGGSHTASASGSTGLLDGTFAPNMTTIFTQGIFLGAVGDGTAAMHGAMREFTMGWGGADYPLPVDFSAAAFTPTASWGANLELLFGSVNQLAWAGTPPQWNGGINNLGNYGSWALSPKRLANEEGDLTTEYVAYA